MVGLRICDLLVLLNLKTRPPNCDQSDSTIFPSGFPPIPFSARLDLFVSRRSDIACGFWRYRRPTPSPLTYIHCPKSCSSDVCSLWSLFLVLLMGIFFPRPWRCLDFMCHDRSLVTPIIDHFHGKSISSTFSKFSFIHVGQIFE